MTCDHLENSHHDGCQHTHPFFREIGQVMLLHIKAVNIFPMIIGIIGISHQSCPMMDFMIYVIHQIRWFSTWPSNVTLNLFSFCHGWAQLCLWLAATGMEYGGLEIQTCSWDSRTMFFYSQSAQPPKFSLTRCCFGYKSKMSKKKSFHFDNLKILKVMFTMVYCLDFLLAAGSKCRSLDVCPYPHIISSEKLLIKTKLWNFIFETSQHLKQQHQNHQIPPSFLLHSLPKTSQRPSCSGAGYPCRRGPHTWRWGSGSVPWATTVWDGTMGWEWKDI